MIRMDFAQNVVETVTIQQIKNEMGVTSHQKAVTSKQTHVT